MKRFECCTVGLLLALVTACQATEWFAAPDATPVGNGSKLQPWQFQVALTNKAIAPGDTVWLRGGTYFPTTTWPSWNVNVLGWAPTLNGTSNNLITICSYSNEWAAIDREWMLKNGASYVRFRDLEFYDSLKGHNLTNSQYPNGPWVHFAGGTLQTAGFEWINCVIHDVDNCWGGGAAGNSVRGCILWYVGWNSLEHVCYGPPYNFSGNISGWHFNDVIEHSFPSFVMQSNILFGTGNTIGTGGGGRDALVDGGGQVNNNYFYNHFSFTPIYDYPQTLSYLSGSTFVNSNIIVGPTPVVYNKTASNSFTSSFIGNTVYANNTNYQAPVVYWAGSAGATNAFDFNNYFSTATVTFVTPTIGYGTTFAQWKSYDPYFDANSTANSSSVPPDSVNIIPNQDQPKRCHIAVYNFSRADNVAVNLSGVLNAGDGYKLYSAQNYNGGAIQSGIYNGTPISVPMTNLTTAPMLYGTNVNYTGDHFVQPPPTSPEFGAFVLIGSSTNTPPRPPSNVHVVPH